MCEAADLVKFLAVSLLAEFLVLRVSDPGLAPDVLADLRL